MKIPIEREPPKERGWPYERCSFCRERTPFWTCLPDRAPGAQVACCEECAEKHAPGEVITKKEWFRKEARK